MRPEVELSNANSPPISSIFIPSRPTSQLHGSHGGLFLVGLGNSSPNTAFMGVTLQKRIALNDFAAKV